MLCLGRKDKMLVKLRLDFLLSSDQ